MSGYAAHYSSGTMERVARYRHMKITDCMVASPYYPIGTWLEVRSKYGTKTCKVIDVPQDRDRKSIIKRGIIVELDFNSAKLLCNISKVNQEPPSACPVKVRKL